MKGKSRSMIDQIRFMYSEGHKIKKISAALGISKNTVKKYIRAILSESFGGETAATSKALASRGEQLDWDYILGQVSLGRPLRVIYNEVKTTRSYSNFTKRIRGHLPKQVLQTAVKLHHEPGDKAQVDYSDGLLIHDPRTGKTTKTQFFCGVLPSSSYVFGEFTWTQKSADFLRSHERMWHFFGGVPKYVVIDNLKPGVSKAHRYDPDINPVYCDFSNHCGFGVLPARVKTPRDKACVEAHIGVIQRDFFETYHHHKFYSLHELNTAFRSYLTDLNGRVMADYGVSRQSRFEIEKPLLGPLPQSSYEFFDWKNAKVHPDCCIELTTSLYSVPSIYVGQTVKVKFNDKMVFILQDHGTETIAVHSRVERYKSSIVEDHLPPNKIQRECFDVKRVQSIGLSIGPKTTEYIDWQFAREDKPLKVLRRLQGLIRFYQTQGVTKESMEFAAQRSLAFKQVRLRYFTDCAAAFKPGRENLHMVNPPKREMTNIHLQKQEFQ